MGSLNKLLSLAAEQVGYQEKKSNAMLDSHNGNAGYRNYTKYSRDVNNWGLAGCQGQPWCATYQFWLEAETFGVETALAHFHMTKKSYQAYNCFHIYEAFARAGCTSNKPKVGVLIVFKHSHIGRVISVKNGRVYTNEGNTSALYGDSNGGTVKTKDYSLHDSNIMGYCLIDYDKDGGTGETASGNDGSESDSGSVLKLRVESFQSWLNTWYPKLLGQYCGGLLEEDGVYGVKTKQAAFTVWKDVLNRLYGSSLSLSGKIFEQSCYEAAGTALIRKGDTGTLPAIAEGVLAAKGFYEGNIDAIFGSGMDKAVREFQKANGLDTDGIIGKDTWRAMFQ